jgi:hypothetical protein
VAGRPGPQMCSPQVLPSALVRPGARLFLGNFTGSHPYSWMRGPKFGTMPAGSRRLSERAYLDLGLLRVRRLLCSVPNVEEK